MQCASPHVPAGRQGDWQLLGAVPAVSLLSPPPCVALSLRGGNHIWEELGLPLGRGGTGQGQDKDSLAAPPPPPEGWVGVLEGAGLGSGAVPLFQTKAPLEIK